MRNNKLLVNKKMAVAFAVVSTFVVTSGAIALASNTEAEEALYTEDTYIAAPAETMMAVIETDETIVIYSNETVEDSTEEITETSAEEIAEDVFVEETEPTAEAEQIEAISDEEVAVVEYDAEGYWYDGWWVPSITLNGDGTASCYLEDGTEFDSFYVGDFAVDVRVWQATSIDNYADYLYGAVGRQNMPSDRYESFMALDSYVWSLT